MAEKAEGYGVQVVIQCIGKDGKVMSDVPRGGWYGFTDEYAMNNAASGLTDAMNAEAKRWNEFKYGPKGPAK
jgi:hypothetical protein